MKRLFILIIGLVISYPLYFYLAHNNGLFSKIPFAIVAFGSWIIFLSGFTEKLKEKSYYKQLGQFSFIVSVILAIITYETFDRLTFGTREEQTTKLAQSNNIAWAKILEIEHFSETTIKRKTIPEHWEIKYEFKDSTNQVYNGIYNQSSLPNQKIGDNIRIKFVKENPEINERMIE